MSIIIILSITAKLSTSSREFTV